MLTVQIGQCGNQLGAALFQRLADETHPEQQHTHHCEHRNAFFRDAASHPSDRSIIASHANATARAVLIDMEPKVVQQCLHGSAASPASAAKQGLTWQYERSNTFTKQSGSGNNWAYGYAVHGAQNETALLELIQTELERCDLHRGFLTLQSVAGGTGSGLGSFLTEQLADTFPSSQLLNAAVWPHASGEVIVQNYNAVLTMASLSRVSHGVLVLQNDAAAAMCRRLLHIARPSFHEMNGVLAAHLASAFLPVETPRAPISEICDELCSHPGYKLLDIKTIPQMPHRSKQFSSHTWPGILKHLHQMQVANAALEEGIDWDVSLATARGRAWNTAVASMLFLRGRDAAATDVSAFNQPAMYAAWRAQPFSWYSSRVPFNAYDKSATLVSNSKAIVPTLASTADKAHTMFAHGAYLHQYARHAVDTAFFDTAFLEVDQVVRNYESLR